MTMSYHSEVGSFAGIAVYIGVSPGCIDLTSFSSSRRRALFVVFVSFGLTTARNRRAEGSYSANLQRGLAQIVKIVSLDWRTLGREGAPVRGQWRGGGGRQERSALASFQV